MKNGNLTGGIPAGILKGCVDSYISISTKIPSTSSERGSFPNELGQKAGQKLLHILIEMI